MDQPMALWVYTFIFVYVLCHHQSLSQTSQETSFLQCVQKVMLIGCNWLTLIHVDYFILQ